MLWQKLPGASCEVAVELDHMLLQAKMEMQVGKKDECEGCQEILYSCCKPDVQVNFTAALLSELCKACPHNSAVYLHYPV